MGTIAPTKGPTMEPTNSPTQVPTNGPTKGPTMEPTNSPTPIPTNTPTKEPTMEPTDSPTTKCSQYPDSSTFVWKENPVKTCEWVGKGAAHKIPIKCKRDSSMNDGLKIYDHCPTTCATVNMGPCA